MREEASFEEARGVEVVGLFGREVAADEGVGLLALVDEGAKGARDGVEEVGSDGELGVGAGASPAQDFPEELVEHLGGVFELLAEGVVGVVEDFGAGDAALEPVLSHLPGAVFGKAREEAFGVSEEEGEVIGFLMEPDGGLAAFSALDCRGIDRLFDEVGEFGEGDARGHVRRFRFRVRRHEERERMAWARASACLRARSRSQ